LKDVQADPQLATTYINQLHRQLVVPQLLFMATSLFVGWVLLFLCRRLPDFILRAGIWWRSLGRRRLRVIGLDHLPGDGPVILATNCTKFEAALQIVASTDRYTEVILLEAAGDADGSGSMPLLRFLARHIGFIALNPASATPIEWELALKSGTSTLQRRDIVALSVTHEDVADELTRLLHDWQLHAKATVVPVYCAAGIERVEPDARVVIGSPLGTHASLAETREAIAALANVMHDPHHVTV